MSRNRPLSLHRTPKRRPATGLTMARRTVAMGLLSALTGLNVNVAQAQVDNLDSGQFIDGLRQYGLSDLLTYYAQTQAPDDGMAPLMIEVAAKRLAFDDENRPQPERRVAIEAAIRVQQRLIDQNPEHPQRALWQTDLAEMALLNHLTVIEQLGLDFVTLGVPTREQQAAYDIYVGVAAINAQQAAANIYELRGTLPAVRDWNLRYVNTGLADRIFKDYGDRLTPFYEGLAAVYAAELGPDAEYWTRASAQVPLGRADRDEERTRLLERAQSELSEFLDDNPPVAPLYLRSARIALGMALTGTGDTEAAIRLFDEVISESRDDLMYVRAALAKALAQQSADNVQAAERTMSQLLDHLDASHPDWIYQKLLATDTLHRIRLSGTGEDASDQELAEAYEPYFKLLEQLEPEVRPGMTGYLAQRWEPAVDRTSDLSTLPIALRDAVGGYRARLGYSLFNGSDVPGAPEADPEAGRAMLERSIEVNESLLADDQAAPDAKLRAAYNLALAKIALNPGNLEVRLEATQPLIELADANPRVPEAEPAIRDAVIWIQQLHQQVLNQPGQFPDLDTAMRRAFEVLLARFGTIPTADDSRLYYAANLLFNQDQDWGAAAEVLDTVPRGHRDYFPAQRLRLTAMWNEYRFSSDEARKNVLLASLSSDANGLSTTAKTASDDQTQAARSADAFAQIVLARIDRARGSNDRALQRLDEIQSDFLSDRDPDPEILIEATQTRIFALADAGEDAQMRDVAADFMNRFPDQAASTINRVVGGLEEEIDALQLTLADLIGDSRTPVQTEIRRKGGIANALASQLVNWSEIGDNANEDQRVLFKLLEARTLWLIGNADQAVLRLAPLMETRHAQSLPVVHHYAEALFHTEDPPKLNQAFQLYSQIDESLKNNAEPGDTWWNARLRQLQIYQIIAPDQGRSIVRNIRQLANRDPRLGGPRFKPEFDRLLDQNSR